MLSIKMVLVIVAIPPPALPTNKIAPWPYAVKFWNTELEMLITDTSKIFIQIVPSAGEEIKLFSILT